MDRKEIDISLSRETTFDVVTSDGKKLFVYCNRAGDKPASKAIVIGHGLGGSPEEYLHMMARNYFNALGYDVYRMAFYWYADDHRKLHETTLAIQGQDLNTVIAHVRDDHDKIFVCGHSYGGLTLVFANPQVNAMSFWDSSYQPANSLWPNSTTTTADGAVHLLHLKNYMSVGQPMISEGKSLTRDVASLMTRQITTPSLILVASEGWLQADNQMLYDDLTCVKEIHTIQGAEHGFAEGHIVYELLDKTYQWFEKY